MRARALAIDIRDKNTGALFGVGLIAPASRYFVILTHAAAIREPALTDRAWDEIDTWADAGDRGLPARPSPLDAEVVVSVLEADGAPVVGQRFASIPIAASSQGELSTLAARVLPRLLTERRSAA